MGVSRVYRVGTPYNGVELAELDYEQTADVMYLAHINHPLTRLERRGHTDWRFVEVTFGPAIVAPTGLAASASSPNTDADNGGNAYFPQPATYVVTAVSDETGQESRGSNTSSATNDLSLKRNSNNLSWTAAPGANRYRIYKSNNTQFFGYIGTTEALTFVDDNIGPALDQGPPVGDNPFAGENDRPSTVALFEQRLILGRTTNRPNGIWASRSGDFENFDISRPLRDDDAIAIGVVAGRVNAINQLVSISSLLALTADAVFKIDGANDQGYLTAMQARARRQIGRGSSRLNPLVVDNVVFYRPNAGSSVRSIGYSFEQDGFKADDVSIFSPHLFRGFNIVDWAYSAEPDSCIWAVRSDGKLLCFTWEQEQQVWGWTQCETDGLVEGVSVISEGGEDRLYLVVRRQVGGNDRVFIERMASPLWTDPHDSCFLDCAVSYTFDPPRTIFRRLNHLEGRTVTAYADGAIYRDLVVTNGRVTIPDAATKATIGLPYEVTVETLPLVLGQGEQAGRRQQLGEGVVRLIGSGEILVGPSEKKLYALKQRLEEAYGDPNDLFDGDYRFDNEPHVSGQVSLVIRQNAPVPLTLAGAFLQPVVGG